MPVILTQVVDTLYQAVSGLELESEGNKIEEGKKLIKVNSKRLVEC